LYDFDWFIDLVDDLHLFLPGIYDIKICKKKRHQLINKENKQELLYYKMKSNVGSAVIMNQLTANQLQQNKKKG